MAAATHISGLAALPTRTHGTEGPRDGYLCPTHSWYGPVTGPANPGRPHGRARRAGHEGPISTARPPMGTSDGPPFGPSGSKSGPELGKRSLGDPFRVPRSPFAPPAGF